MTIADKEALLEASVKETEWWVREGAGGRELTPKTQGEGQGGLTLSLRAPAARAADAVVPLGISELLWRRRERGVSFHRCSGGPRGRSGHMWSVRERVLVVEKHQYP